jgi:hypothetical protein
MPETGGSNIEVAHHLNETKGHAGDEPTRRAEILEIFEAVVLALVAIATAWSGYQAARWDGQQSILYGHASKLRIEAQGTAARGTQVQLYDGLTVTEWLKAEAHGDTKLAALFERRLLPEFRPAFEAWKATDPIHNPNAPAGPVLMPQYHNEAAEKAEKMDQDASEIFEVGTQARERADQYVRVTVTLATVLLLAAISQRFKTTSIRASLIVLAFLILLVPLWRILTLPRL